MPLIRVTDVHVGRDYFQRPWRTLRSRIKNKAAVYGQREGGILGATPRCSPHRGGRHLKRTQPAIVDSGGREVSIHQVANGCHRNRNRLCEVVGRLGRAETRRVFDSKVKFFFYVKSLSEIVNRDHKDNQQRQHQGEFHDLGSAIFIRSQQSSHQSSARISTCAFN